MQLLLPREQSLAKQRVLLSDSARLGQEPVECGLSALHGGGQIRVSFDELAVQSVRLVVSLEPDQLVDRQVVLQVLFCWWSSFFRYRVLGAELTQEIRITTSVQCV